MFDFLDMMENHEQRLVDNYKQGDLEIDTCAVTDSKQPYETGISHPAYNEGSWVIVEMYNTKIEAQKGHDIWVQTMTAKEMPDQLIDISTASIAILCSAVSENDDWRKKPKSVAN